MDVSSIVSIVSAVVSLVGAFVIIYKLQPERKKIIAEGKKIEAESRKLDSDSLSSIANAAESIASGAKVSNEQLLKRIEEMEVREVKREEDISRIKNEAAVTRTELYSVRAELIEWKDYAFRLAHQVKSLGHEPVPFKPKQAHNSPP